MERAGKSLWKALRRVARPERPLDLLIAVWPLMVGQRMASHTRPRSWRAGRVTVEVTDPEWQRQLEEMPEVLRKQINRWWGSNFVREVKFVRGKAESPPVPPAPARTQAASEKAEGKLGAALAEFEGQLSGVADEELRNLIGRVAARYLSGKDK